MCTCKRLHRGHLEEILNELKAINAWDRHFFFEEEPDLIEFVAWEARRLRVLEIFQEISQNVNRSTDRDYD